MKDYHVILIYAQDKKGVIERISMLFRRKMYNIHQISTSITKDTDIRKITVRIDSLEKDKIPQILKQINKIVEVVDVICVDDETAILTEIAFIKIKNDENILNYLKDSIKNLEIVNLSEEEIICRIIKEPEELSKNVDLIRKKADILELTTSGIIAIKK